LPDLLSIGKTGLMASKKALETTGHNLSNVNTEGFSRQKVHQSTNVTIPKGGLSHGTGTRITRISRFHDKFVEKRLTDAVSQFNANEQRLDKLEQVENIFNEIDGTGLNNLVNNFFNSFRELSNHPEDETLRSLVRDNAGLVVNDFQQIIKTLETVEASIDDRYQNDIENVNTILHATAKLNRKINDIENVGGETGDLRDQRDLQIRRLSEYFKVNTYIDEKGQYIVAAKNVGTVVSGTIVQELMVGANMMNGKTILDAGNKEVFFRNRQSSPITHRFRTGKFSALNKLKTGDIKELKRSVDNIAFHVANSVNAVHKHGYVNRQIPVSEDGKPNLFDTKGPTTNLNFFAVPNQIDGAAKNLKLSAKITEDLSNIAAALSPNAPGDNRVAIGISKLQNEKITDGGTTTIEEEYLKTIGKIGLETGKAKVDREQANGLMLQAQSLRERLSGVSIDEEAASMVRYQQSYDASAKVLKAAEEMFQTVISIKR
jgi:flagellar hook-associated protein 1